MPTANPICLRLDKHLVDTARALALAKAGSNMPARIAMMAITTSSSIRVNPARSCLPLDEERGVDFIVSWVGEWLNWLRLRGRVGIHELYFQSLFVHRVLFPGRSRRDGFDDPGFHEF